MPRYIADILYSVRRGLMRLPLVRHRTTPLIRTVLENLTSELSLGIIPV